MTLPKGKGILINLGLLIGSLVFSFVLLEVGVRMFFPSPQSPNIFDPVIGYKYRPSSNVIAFVQGKPVVNKVNSIGFLDEEHTFENPQDNYRIVFIGDSYTEATNVLREKTYPKILEKELNKPYAGRIETINLGMNGFGTAHEYLTLQEYGLKLSPDLVILVFIENDLENNLSKFSTDMNPAFDIIEGELVQTRIPKPLKGGTLRSLISKLQLPRFLVRQFSKIGFFKNVFIDQNLISAVKDLPDDAIPFSLRRYSKVFQQDEDVLTSWQITKALIKETAELSKDNNSDFLVVVPASLPDPEAEASIVKKYPELQDIDFNIIRETLLNYLQKEKIDYLDTLPAIEKAKELLYYSGEDGGHYNEEGHKMMAGAIFDYLLENNLIKTNELTH